MGSRKEVALAAAEPDMQIHRPIAILMALHPELIASLSFNLTHGAISGNSAGIFSGSMLIYSFPNIDSLKDYPFSG
ncbi:TPA: hypothetical protein JD264_25800 [Serratia fonticola]|nr:hypothetical protein [Serratia fonticola]HAU5567189.1 hypothetical protein [Serratia fonticola]